MTVQEAINTRYSTRNYVPNVKIEDEKINLILDAGAKAPNGLAFEPWMFYAIDGNLDAVYDATNNQKHAKDASFVVALVNYKQELVDEKPEVLTDKLNKAGFPKEQADMYLKYVRLVGTQYYREQLMFAGAQMVLQATELGIGSVVVGGFNKEAMGNIIGIDQEKYEVGLVITFGINADEKPKQRVRRDRDEVVRRITL